MRIDCESRNFVQTELAQLWSSNRVNAAVFSLALKDIKSKKEKQQKFWQSEVELILGREEEEKSSLLVKQFESC